MSGSTVHGEQYRLLKDMVDMILCMRSATADCEETCICVYTVECYCTVDCENTCICVCGVIL